MHHHNTACHPGLFLPRLNEYLLPERYAPVSVAFSNLYMPWGPEAMNRDLQWLQPCILTCGHREDECRFDTYTDMKVSLKCSRIQISCFRNGHLERTTLRLHVLGFRSRPDTLTRQHIQQGYRATWSRIMISMVTHTDDEVVLFESRHRKQRMPKLPWSSDIIGVERLVAVRFGDTKQAKRMDRGILSRSEKRKRKEY